MSRWTEKDASTAIRLVRSMAVLALLWLILFGLSKCHGQPFAYDPNLCNGPIMDWAFCEPNTPIIYTVSLHFPVGDPNQIDVGALTLDVNAPALDDFVSQYWGVIPEISGGYNYVWTFSFTPRTEEVYYLQIHAIYEYQAHTQAWSKRTGEDKRTVLLNCTTQQKPHLRPGPSPESMGLALMHMQYRKKQGKTFGYAKVIR